MSASESVIPPSPDHAEAQEALATRLRLAVPFLCALAAALAAVVLAGWALNVPFVLGSPDHRVLMTVNSAFVLLLTTGSVWLYARNGPALDPPRPLLLCVGTAVLLSFAPLLERLTGWRLGVDAVFAATSGGTLAVPGPEATTAIVGALLLQGAIVLAVHPARYAAAQTLAFGTLMLATFDVTRHLLGPHAATGAGVMAAPTAVGLLLLASALLLAHPERGVMRAAIDPGLGGILVRRLLPLAIVVPIVLAWLVWESVGKTLDALAIGQALTITLTVVALGGTLLWGARRLRVIERDRQDAEVRRRHAEDRWRGAVTDAPIPMVVHDGDQIVDMNRAWVEIAGIDTSAAPTITAWVAQTQPTRVSSLPAFRARLAAATGTVQDGEQIIRAPDDEVRVWEFSTTPIGPSGTDRRLFVSTAVDVTARRRSEVTLQQLNEELEQRIAERTAALTRANDVLKRQSEQVREQTLLLDLVRDGILVRDLYGTIVYWNRGATAMYGWSSEQALGKLSHHLLGAEYPMPVADIEKQVMRTGFWEGDVVHVTHEGKRLLVESRWTLTRTERGAAEGFLEVNRDISQRRQAERALQAKADALARSNHELEQFAYVASHDLQEPLRMVSNYTQLLARRYRDRLDPDANEFIDFAVDGAKRMQDLIHDLLQYARVERSGRDFRPVQAERIVADALSNLASAIDESSAGIVVDPLPTLTCDASQMTQVFQNLIGNAIKFRRPDVAPVIRVVATRDDGAWRLTVSDNGIGIESRFFDRIFQMFQRLHGRGEYSGTGIGLALCKKIVERHGGRIWVESEPGRGSTFFLTVPDAAPTM